MSHKCEAALITCEDFRLHQRKDSRNYIADFIKEKNVDCDVITRAGGIQDIVRGEEAGFEKSLLRDSEVSAKLHSCSVIYLINHEDCGAYSSMNFNDREEEIETHLQDLKEAKEKIAEVSPEVKIETYFGYLKENTTDEFDIKEV